jgi:hypothetical protein
MNQVFFLLALLAAVGGLAQAAPVAASSAATYRILLIDPSSMPVAAGKATLIIGALQRANGVFTGDYQIKIFPYFLKNEKGRLAIIVSDKSLADVSQGKVAAITGTATTSGTGGKCRTIAATATPTDTHRGKLKLWFTAGDRKMTFEPAYHFVGKETASVPAPPATTKLAAINL